MFAENRSNDKAGDTIGLNCIEPYAWLERTLEKPLSYPANHAHELLPQTKQVSLNICPRISLPRLAGSLANPRRRPTGQKEGV